MMNKKHLHNIYIILGIICSTLAMNVNFEIEIHSLASLCKNFFVSPLWIIIETCIVSVLVYFKHAFSYKKSKTVEITSVFLTLFTILGYNFYRSNQMFPEALSLYMVILYIIQFFGYYFLFKNIVIIIFQLLAAFQSKSLFSDNSSNIKSFYLYFIILLLAKIPYVIILFPGVTTADSLSQIGQAVNAEALSNHHPIFMTYILKIFIKIGNLIGDNILTGVFLYTTFQMLFTTAILAYVIYYLKKQGAHKFIIIGLILFYTIYPITAIYSVTVWKDVLLSYFILVYCMLIYDICIDHSFFKQWKKIVVFIVCIFCLLFIKKTGLYIVVLTFPIIVLTNKNLWKPITSIIMLTLLIYFVVTGPIFKSMNFESGDAKEGISVVMQSYARTVYDHGDDLNSEEWRLIHDVIPYEKDEIKTAYDPRCSNPIKNAFVTNQFKENLSDQIFNWVSLGIQYPGTYIESFLNGSFGYWYPDDSHWTFSTASYLEVDRESKKIYDSNLDTYNSKYMINEKETLMTLDNTEFKQAYPFIGLFFTIAPYTWIYGLLCMFLIHKKGYLNLIAFSPLFIVFLTCLASPVHGEFRYAYPIVLTAPIMLVLCLKKRSLKEKEV